jgi:hypothetical protein
VGSTGLGLLLEEHRGEIIATWRQRIQRELGVAEPALAFAVAPLLREMALALGGQGAEARSRDAWTRCAVLVRSTASAAQLAREFKLLHRGIWEALRARGAPVSQLDRGSADEWLDEALAESLERLERVRLRVASFARTPVVIPAAARTTPPPLPPRARRPTAGRRAGPPDEIIVDLEPMR